jgi:hypothetical protein
MVRGRGLPASNSLKSKVRKSPNPQDLGAAVLAHIQARENKLVSFTTPAGDKARIWLSDRRARKGEAIYWRVNLQALKKRGEKRCGFSEPRKATLDIIEIEGSSHVPLTRLKPNPPARDPACVQPDTWPRSRGYKVRFYIEAEKELQQLGCGWRIVIVELDGSCVHLHHNGRTATLKRDAFKALLARNKRPKRPQLKLVVSNPPKPDERVSDAA